MAIAIGIDLGTHSVKLALMEGRLGKTEQARLELRKVPQDEESAPDEARRLLVLAGLMEDLGKLPDGTWSAGYPAEFASLRTLTMPFIDRGQITKTLPFEIEGHIPFDLQDFIMDYRILRQAEGKSQVLCALAEKTEIKNLLSGLSQAKVDPRHLLLDAEALSFLGGETGCRVVADIGHTRSIVALVADGQMIDARAISFGGRELTLAVSRHFNLAWGDAEGAKHAAELGSASDVKIEWDEDETDASTASTAGGGSVAEVLRDALIPLVSNLRATLMAFEDRHGREVEELLLVGGTAGMGGLPEWLSGALGLAVRRPEISEEAEQAGEPGRFAMAYCLAARSAGATRGRELDFRKDEFVFRGDLARIRQWAGVGATALGVFCATALIMFAVRYSQLSSALETLDAQIVEEVAAAFPDVPANVISTPMSARAVVVEKTTEAMERMESLGAVVGGEPPVLSMLQELSASMPPAGEARVEVSELKYSEKSIYLKAETLSFESAAAIESSVRRNEKFAGAIKADEKKRSDGLSFSLTIPLDGGEDEEQTGGAEEEGG